MVSTTFLKNNEKSFQIRIDSVEYIVGRPRLTSADLRRLPQPPIAWRIDLFEIVPGQPYRKVEDRDFVTLRNGQRFTTTPGQTEVTLKVG